MKKYIGIDLGGTRTKIALFDEEYDLVAEKIMPTNANIGHKNTINNIADNIVLMLKEKDISIDLIDYIGVGVAASIDYKTNKLIYANNLGWEDVQLAKEIKVYFNKDVYLVNDACAAALAEQKVGSSMGYENSVLVTLGTGIGAGIIIDNKLFLGGDRYGVEIGHMVIDANGKKCNCGKRGCFETFASVSSLINDVKSSVEVKDSIIMELCNNDLSILKGEMIFEAVKMGDGFSEEIVKNYIDHLAVGISNVILMYRPQIVIIGGGITQVGNLLMEPLRKRVLELNSDMEILPVPKITKTKLGNKAGTLGAVLAGKAL